MFKSTNPATGEVIATFAPHEREEIQKRIERAHTAYTSWRNMRFEERESLFLALADGLDASLEKFATLITHEMGKPINESRSEIQKCARACRHFASATADYLATEPVSTEAQASYIRYDPVGLVFAIMPWNFPFWQVVRFMAPVVMSGNVILFKHAPTTMGCGEAIADLAAEVGFPEGVIQTLRITPQVAKSVIGDERVRGVTFTGSTRGGREVAAIAGQHGKKSVLELGGSDPFIVLQDADVQRAAASAVASRLLNTGQSCSAAKRFIVSAAVVDEFTDAAVELMRSRSLGDPMDETTDLGPLARDDLRKSLALQISQSVSRGAKTALEGGPVSGPGYFFEPVLLTDADRKHPVWTEETFGPVGVIATAANEAAAISLANDSEYGLAAAVWTSDNERGHQIAMELDVGVVSINDMVKSDPRLPFGGVKASGYGRELYSHGTREFINAKSVWAM